MGACCWVDTSEGEAAAIHEIKIRRARKEWRCCECHEAIPKGAQYEHVRGLWDGRWSGYRTCWTCTLIRDEYCGYGYYYGELRETLYDCLGFDYTTNELAPWAKDEDEREEHHRKGH